MLYEVITQKAGQPGVVGQGHSWEGRALQRLPVEELLAEQAGQGRKRAAADQEQSCATLEGP